MTYGQVRSLAVRIDSRVVLAGFDTVSARLMDSRSSFVGSVKVAIRAGVFAGSARARAREA